MKKNKIILMVTIVVSLAIVIFSAMYFGKKINFKETDTFKNISESTEDVYVYGYETKRLASNIKEDILNFLKDAKLTNNISLVKPSENNLILKVGDSTINILGENKLALDGKVYKTKDVNMYDLVLNLDKKYELKNILTNNLGIIE